MTGPGQPAAHESVIRESSTGRCDLRAVLTAAGWFTWLLVGVRYPSELSRVLENAVATVQATIRRTYEAGESGGWVALPAAVLSGMLRGC